MAMKKAPKIKSMIMPSFDSRPRISFTEDELPEIKEWSVGKKYKLEIKVEMTGINKMEYGENKNKIQGQFKVISTNVEEKE